MAGQPNVGDVVRSVDTSWGVSWRVIGFKADLQGVTHAIIEAPATLERRTLAVATLCDPKRFRVQRRSAGPFDG